MDKIRPYTYASFIYQFDRAKDTAAELILSIDEYTFLSRPAPETWCIAECFSHLNNFGKIYLDTIRQGIDADAPSGAEADSPFPPRFYWKWIIDWFEPPYKIKVKTFRPFEPEPVSGFTRQQVLKDFTDLQDRFIAQLEQTKQQGYDLGMIKVQNPIFTFVGMRLSECYAVVTAHQRRHFWQTRQILKILNAE